MVANRSSPDPKRVRHGIIMIALLTAASGAVFVLDIVVRATAEGGRVTVVAEAAPGLRPGSAVWVAGRPMGRVLSISFQEPGAEDGIVVIRAALDREAEPILRADARAEVRAPELLAAVVVSVDPGSAAAPPWNYADTLHSSGRHIDPQMIMALSDTLMDAAGRLKTESAAMGQRLEAASGSLPRLRRNPQVLQRLQEDLARAREINQRMATSSLAKLSSEPVLRATATRIRQRLEAWRTAPERESTSRSLREATGALDALGRRVLALSDRLDAGEGTAGRALRDGEILRQIEALRAGIRALTEDLTYAPSRWLRVRVF